MNNEKKTIEEKIKEAKRLYKTANTDQRYVLESLFPELKESEDERIRKELIEQVIYIIPDKSEVDDNGNTLPCYTTRINKYIAWLEKQGEQKPAAWSEEDEDMLNKLILHFDWTADYRFDKSDCDAARNWLKSLKDRVQPQNTWKPSEDLEEAAKHYLYSNILYDDVYVGNPTDKDCIEMFKAGAMWQKEQLMKGFCFETKVYHDDDGTTEDGNYEEWWNLEDSEIIDVPVEELGLKDGDKVNVIIVKAD